MEGSYVGNIPVRYVKRAEKRCYFEHHLITVWGFVLERELASDNNTVYVKIHVPLNILQKRVRPFARERRDGGWTIDVCSHCSTPGRLPAVLHAAAA